MFGVSGPLAAKADQKFDAVLQYDIGYWIFPRFFSALCSTLGAAPLQGGHPPPLQGGYPFQNSGQLTSVKVTERMPAKVVKEILSGAFAELYRNSGFQKPFPGIAMSTLLSLW